MGNHELLDRFEAWLLSTDRAEGTIKLRMRYMRELACVADLRQVTLDTLEQELGRMRKTHAPETRKSVLASWHVFFQWAHRRGIRFDDPTAEIVPIRVPVRVPRVAPDDAVLGAIEGASPRDRALVLLARYGCLRLTELTTLRKSAREGEQLRIIGKGDKERIVYANEPLLFALHAVERDHDDEYYFPGQDEGHLHPMSVNKIIRRLTGWNPHSLRHAGATAAYLLTRDLEGVRDMLGHASVASTQRYLHLDDTARRRVAAATVIVDRIAA